ncbi:hypothetical protein Q1695_016239 [Nippostrongylus brasiliensis]|nr:hypothetical protein Q1695_016239 [Nippostrongylus brasiliensis]
MRRLQGLLFVFAVAAATESTYECGQTPGWIHRMFYLYHLETGAKFIMDCATNNEAMWAAEHLLKNNRDTVNRKYWCRTALRVQTSLSFDEQTVTNEMLIPHFNETRVKQIGEKFPNTIYGCSALLKMDRNKNKDILLMCIYQKQANSANKDGEVNDCPEGSDIDYITITSQHKRNYTLFDWILTPYTM